MAEREDMSLPVGRLDVHGFEAMGLEVFGEDVVRRLVGRPLDSITLFRDARSNLPGCLLIFGGPAPLVGDQGLIVSARPTRQHPFVELTTLLVDGVEHGLLQYQQAPDTPAAEETQPDESMAGRTETVNQLLEVLWRLNAVTGALRSGEDCPLRAGPTRRGPRSGDPHVRTGHRG